MNIKSWIVLFLITSSVSAQAPKEYNQGDLNHLFQQLNMRLTLLESRPILTDDVIVSKFQPHTTKDGTIWLNPQTGIVKILSENSWGELFNLNGEDGDNILAMTDTISTLATQGYVDRELDGLEFMINASRVNPFYATDFFSKFPDANQPWYGQAISSGTLASVLAGAPDGDHPGIVRMQSTTTLNSGYRVLCEITSHLIAGGEGCELIFYIPVDTTESTITFGWCDAYDVNDAVDGVYFRDEPGAFLVGKTANNSTRSTTATSYELEYATWYRAKLQINSDASKAYYYLYDTDASLLWSDSLTTNIPTAATRVVGNCVVATEGSTTATDLIYLDYMAMWFDGRTLTR